MSFEPPSNDGGDTRERSDATTSMPLASEGYAWPTAELDPVTKMRALALALPHAAVDETVLDVPFERFWAFIADLESNTHRFEGNVTRARVLERRGDRMRLRAWMPGGLSTDFEVVLKPGWCLMQSRFGQVGMAARPEGPERTRFIHLEGARLFGRLARPYFRWNIRQDFRRLRELLETNDSA